MTIRGNKRIRSRTRCLAILLGGFLAGLYGISAPMLAAQDWFKTGTGMGVSKARVGLADWAARNPDSQTFATEFASVVRVDLEYSGIVDVVSQSMNPTQSPSLPTELNAQSWTDPPANAQLVAYGNLTVTGNNVEVDGWLNSSWTRMRPVQRWRDG